MPSYRDTPCSPKPSPGLACASDMQWRLMVRLIISTSTRTLHGQAGKFYDGRKTARTLFSERKNSLYRVICVRPRSFASATSKPVKKNSCFCGASSIPPPGTRRGLDPWTRSWQPRRDWAVHHGSILRRRHKQEEKRAFWAEDTQFGEGWRFYRKKGSHLNVVFSRMKHNCLFSSWE